MGCCGNGSKGCGSGCTGHAEQESLNSVVEMEIYYKESRDAEEGSIIFVKLCYITNTQSEHLKLTGHEGYKYRSFEDMKHDILDALKEPGKTDCISNSDVEISFVLVDDYQ